MAETNKNMAGNADGENEEEVISMVDYLQEEEELEDDVNAVLGDSDENQCTYSLGYVSRQALYACATCATKETAPAGVCLACSYACHEGHDLYELYTKRNFRCDCGNGKFVEQKCKLCPTKEDINAENQYNQNFIGTYCICSRPYPDPDDDIEDEMVQCVICEDWYHGRHLGTECKSLPGEFQEMICNRCMHKHNFLWAYNVQSKENETITSECSSSQVDIEDNCRSQQKDSAINGSQSAEKSAKVISNCEVVSKLGDSCLLKDLQTRDIDMKDSATFWHVGFRSKLCSCLKCKDMYNAQNIEFITDERDTMAAYEERGKAKNTASSHQDRERQILEGMGRVQQIELVQGFNDMKSALNDYLKHFAENGKVVREEDIREFFSQMEQRKKQKTGQTPAHFCR